jgi:hypothetical protein
MNVAVLDYSQGKIFYIKDLPSDWDNNQMEDYLYNNLQFNEDEISWMITNDRDDFNIIMYEPIRHDCRS